MKKTSLLRLALACALTIGAGAAQVFAKQPAVDAALLLEDVRTLASPEFAGRKTGSEGSRKAQAFLQARFAALGLKPFGATYAQPFSFTHAGKNRTEYPAAANYVGYIKGREKPDRFIVISAHYDHLGVGAGQLYPGADDNASGVSAMLAIAAWFKAHPPRHSIVFAAFDAEELGLRGARAFLGKLPFPKQHLVMNLNLDMVAHNDNNRIFAAGTSYTPAFKPLVEQAAARSTVTVKLGHDTRQPGAAASADWTNSSDHGPFHQAGIPFLYFGVEEHADYHAPSDTFERLNQKFFVKVAALLVDVAATLDKKLE